MVVEHVLRAQESGNIRPFQLSVGVFPSLHSRANLGAEPIAVSDVSHANGAPVRHNHCVSGWALAAILEYTYQYGTVRCPPRWLSQPCFTTGQMTLMDTGRALTTLAASRRDSLASRPDDAPRACGHKQAHTL